MPMSILASVCWEAGSVWLCGGWVCGIPRVVACSRAVCWFGARVLAWSVLGPRWWRARVCVRVVAWSRVCGCACSCVWVCVWGGRARVCAAPLLVVCCGGFLLSRTPWGAVPLARPGLASRFGMLLGVSPVL